MKQVKGDGGTVIRKLKIAQIYNEHFHNLIEIMKMFTIMLSELILCFLKEISMSN